MHSTAGFTKDLIRLITYAVGLQELLRFDLQLPEA